ncbi:mechanosensitive ion channel family protein [Candidatus Woesearchaeota archaeon]|nr:mechanosensitive ion channel family protein [Candidatus Woesearchaeota archaeon]
MLEQITAMLSNFYVNLVIRTTIIVIVFLFLKIVTKWYLMKWHQRIIKSQDTTETKRSKETRIRLLNKLISWTLFLLAAVTILAGVPQFKSFSYSLLASAGLIAIILGFATQKTLSNVVSGIFLALYEPFRIGDKIKILDQYGEVEDLTLRHTIIKTWDNKRIVVPNSRIDEQEIINFSLKEEILKWTIDMGISYDSDIDKARKIMIEAADKHPLNLGRRMKEEEYQPIVRVTQCGDFAVNLRLYFWCEDLWSAWTMGFDLTESIKKEFDKKGIEIPFPYRTIVYKKDLEAKKRKQGKRKK